MTREPEDDLDARIQFLLDGTLAPDEVARLDAELRESREARARYLQYAALLSALEEQACSQAAIAHVPVIPVDRLLARQRKHTMRRSLLAAAAVILISAIGFWLKMATPHPASVARFRLGPDSVFTLSQADGSPSPQPGNVLSEGSRLRMTHGSMEGMFASGVRCVIEAPCDLSVLANDRIAMAEGLAWFEVPRQAVGFRVETPQLTVVDLGTVFGVLAPGGRRHEIHVAKGAVQAVSGLSANPRRKLVVKAGEARQVDEQGEFRTVTNAPERFSTRLSEAVQITNPSFEANRNLSPIGEYREGRPHDFDGGITGWVGLVRDRQGVMIGWKGIAERQLHPYPVEGGHNSQALSLLSNTCVLNRTSIPWSSLRAGDRLTLTVSLGMRGDTPDIAWNEGTFFGLVDGSIKSKGLPGIAQTVANSGLISVNPATGSSRGDGRFTDSSFHYIIRPADLTRPGKIGILLAAGSSQPANTGQSCFDHVRLHRRPATSSEQDDGGSLAPDP